MIGSAGEIGRDDDEFVRAALVALAATDQLKQQKWSRESEQPVFTATYVILVSAFEDLKDAYPEVELVQRASLRPDVTSDGFTVDSDIFTDSVMIIPFFGPLADEIEFRDRVSEELRHAIYFSAKAMMLTAAPSTSPSKLPTREEFVELCTWLARGGSEIASMLRGVSDADALFGADQANLAHLRMKTRGLPPDSPLSPDDWALVVPVVRYQQTLQKWIASLEASAERDQPSSARGARLRSVAVRELKLLWVTLGWCYKIFNEIDALLEPEKAGSYLAAAVAQASLPVTRALAAEHLSYVYNRAGVTSRVGDLAESFYSAAAECAHYAYVTSGRPRSAKYIAQNMLEVATRRNDDVLRAYAETVWSDAYVVPYHLGLHWGNGALNNLGWTTPIYAAEPLVPYNAIPARSRDPQFIYEGRVADVLRRVSPSFPPDCWTAAILVVQRFKALQSPVVSATYDLRLPLYVPGAEGTDRFPMLQQHPIAWFYFLADRLLAEHARKHPHAGLGGTRAVEWEQRRWLEATLDDYRWRLSGQASKRERRSPILPAFATYILSPVVDQLRNSGQEQLAAQWSGVVRSWS